MLLGFDSSTVTIGTVKSTTDLPRQSSRFRARYESLLKSALLFVKNKKINKTEIHALNTHYLQPVLKDPYLFSQRTQWPSLMFKSWSGPGQFRAVLHPAGHPAALQQGPARHRESLLSGRSTHVYMKEPFKHAFDKE